MYKIKETIIVEGVYDKIKLSGFIDGIIITTNGFGVFSDKRIIKTISEMAKKTGVVILTDSDSAGFKIRNYIKQLLPVENVKHAYIPEIKGKERRKRIPGKEGILGVEGIKEETILDALKKAGCEIDGVFSNEKSGRKILKADLYKMGLSGAAQSKKKRAALAASLGIPMKISANMLLDVLNRLFTYEEFCDFAQNILQGFKKNQ